jgi:hypothetical protein
MVFERAFMEEELDPFDYTLAEALGMTLQTMRDTMPNNEYLSWRAFYVWREAKREIAAKEIKRGR